VYERGSSRERSSSLDKSEQRQRKERGKRVTSKKKKEPQRENRPDRKDEMDEIDEMDKMYRGFKFLVSLGPEGGWSERGEEKVEVHESPHNRQLQRSTTTWNPKVQLWINTQTQAAQAALGRIRTAPAETQRVSSLPPVFPFPGHEPSRSLCQRYQGLLSTQTRTFTTVFSPAVSPLIQSTTGHGLP
jgi:hypothetical protein